MLDFWAMMRPFETREGDGKVRIKLGGVFCSRGAGGAGLDEAETAGFLCGEGRKEGEPLLLLYDRRTALWFSCALSFFSALSSLRSSFCIACLFVDVASRERA